MKRAKREKLRKHGWQVGDAKEFLGLTPEEAEYVEMKVSLSHALQEKRKRKHLSQEKLAKLVKSSQSRIAKMENGDPSVSLDLLIKALLALGATRRELSKALV